MTAAIANASTTIADSLAGAGIAIADDELEILLEQAGAAKPRSREALAAYVGEQLHPWTTQNPHCPYAFARLTHLLWQSGYPVQPVACAQCGRITPKLDRVIDGARCCGWCASRRTQHVCASLRAVRPTRLSSDDRIGRTLPALLSERPRSTRSVHWMRSRPRPFQTHRRWLAALRQLRTP